MRKLEVRTTKDKLLVGVFTQAEKGKICLEIKHGKRTDYIPFEELLKSAKQFFDENSKELEQNVYDLDELVCL